MNLHDWSDEMVVRLRELYDQGTSGTIAARMINKEFGTAKTRNSVIGKWHRLGLLKPRTPSLTAHRRSRKSKDRDLASMKTPPKPDPVTVEKSVVIVPDALPADRNVPLMQLKEHHCRWPVGEKPYHFCGAKKVRGAFCKAHAQRAYGSSDAA